MDINKKAAFFLCLLGACTGGLLFGRKMPEYIKGGQAGKTSSCFSLSVSRNEAGRILSPQDYENIAVSHVSDYVNVRQAPGTTSAIVGKIYNNCAADILETVEGEGGLWYRIRSGNVSGYIKAQYFITGAQAEAIAREIGIEYAAINTAALRLRAEPNLTSETLTMLTQGAEYVVIEEKDGFARLLVDEDMEGYVSMDYIKTRIEFQHAVSLEEEAAKLAEEARRRQDAQDAFRALEEVKMVEAKDDSASYVPARTGVPGGGSTQGGSLPATAAGNPASAAPQSQTDGAGVPIIAANPLGAGDDPRVSAPVQTTAAASAPTSSVLSPAADGGASSAVVTATRTALVAYAKQFLGNPYVYGGSSLTDGADCSGFVMRIYEHFGIDTGRSSRDQAAKGRQIAIDAVQPGDLLFYASGSYINHVAIYIGGGQVIHAASSRTGIIISPSNYRTPCRAVTFLD